MILLFPLQHHIRGIIPRRMLTRPGVEPVDLNDTSIHATYHFVVNCKCYMRAISLQGNNATRIIGERKELLLLGLRRDVVNSQCCRIMVKIGRRKINIRRVRTWR